MASSGIFLPLECGPCVCYEGSWPPERRSYVNYDKKCADPLGARPYGPLRTPLWEELKENPGGTPKVEKRTLADRLTGPQTAPRDPGARTLRVVTKERGLGGASGARIPRL